MKLLTIIDNPVNLDTTAEAAMQRLQASPYIVLRKISCECNDGVLVLYGRVFSFHEKQIAQETVIGIKGMTQVVNQIDVD